MSAVRPLPSGRAEMTAADVALSRSIAAVLADLDRSHPRPGMVRATVYGEDGMVLHRCELDPWDATLTKAGELMHAHGGVSCAYRQVVRP